MRAHFPTQEEDSREVGINSSAPPKMDRNAPREIAGERTGGQLNCVKLFN